MRNTILYLCLLILVGVSLSAQELLDIDLSRRCVYSGNYMDEELYSFSPESDEMISRVKEILKLGGDLKINFYLIETNVENVSAVVDGGKRYLLWSQDFIHGAGRIERIGTIAHEMAHHLNHHQLSPERRKVEEAEADFFMGFILSKSNFSKQEIKAFLAKMPLSGDRGFNAARYKNVMKGYQKGEASLMLSTLAWEDAGAASMKNFLKAQFPFPPPQCHTSYEIPNTYFRTCHTLGAVAEKISTSLEQKQYPFRYMSVPNGFAIVTQMEQYHSDGRIMSGSAYRWLDYPPQESFALTWEYFKSLIYPKKGHLRLFVFIVTSQNFSSDKKRVSKDDAASWLSQGVNRLPKPIASEPFNEDYSVSFLTYEFEVPESNHLVRQTCPCRYQAVEHFRLSGLYKLLGSFP
ncbi:MAG TPA: hypothetical protein ENJ45_03715 [Phaeodactylibacter sp.]|nr:hypothetical protein [Phaeodactylibacter sp.]